jgi:hypothetical protein
MTMIFSMQDCNNHSVANGLCEKHYRRFRRHGDPAMSTRLLPGTYTKCIVDGCLSPHLSRGYCNKHYSRWRRNGDPLACQYDKPPNGAPRRWLEEQALTFVGDDCLIYPFALAMGYGQLWIEGVKTSAHRYVCVNFQGPAPSPDHQAAHECGCRNCVNPSHITWKTAAENAADKLKHNTHNRGTRNHNVKLSEADVFMIRRMDGTHEEIAQSFGISRRTVGAIKDGTIWGWLS